MMSTQLYSLTSLFGDGEAYSPSQLTRKLDYFLSDCWLYTPIPSSEAPSTEQVPPLDGGSQLVTRIVRRFACTEPRCLAAMFLEVRKHEDRRTLPAGEYHRWDEVDDDIADDRLHRTLKYRCCLTAKEIVVHLVMSPIVRAVKTVQENHGVSSPTTLVALLRLYHILSHLDVENESTWTLRKNDEKLQRDFCGFSPEFEQLLLAIGFRSMSKDLGHGPEAVYCFPMEEERVRSEVENPISDFRATMLSLWDFLRRLVVPQEGQEC